MEQCGISTESGVTESTENVSPVSGVSGWCSLDTHSGYTSPTSVAPVCLQSMNIIRRDLGDKLNRLLLYKREMATADESSDYKIHITVENNTVETGQDDFWFS